MNVARMMSLSLVVLTLWVLPLGARAAEEGEQPTVTLGIEPQPLGDALNAFGQQSGLQIVFVYSELAQSTLSPRLVGRYSPQSALDELLANTEFRYEFLNDRTVAIRPKKSAASDGQAGADSHRVSELQLAQAGDNPENSASGSAASSSQRSDRENDSTAVSKEASLEEIIVTARKVTERLQDAPISVTAFSGKQLEELGAVDVKDVLMMVPGLSFSGVERGRARYSIRGISTNAESPTVGVYLDDIPLLTQTTAVGTGAFDAILFDVDRVEVLKGPQGTLFGGSAMGGAIRYISARPDLSAFSGNLATGIGGISHGDLSYNAEAVVNVPLVPDVLGLRAGFSYIHEGGYIDNVAGLDIENTARSSTPFPTYTPQVRPSESTVSENDYNDSDTYVARVSLQWEPDSSWSIRPALTYQDSTQDNPPVFHTNNAELTSTYRTNAQESSERAGIYSLDINKTIGAVELTSVTGYFDRDVKWARDYAYFVGNIVQPFYSANSLYAQAFETKTFSQEMRIASAPEVDGRLRWVAGLYYRDQDQVFTSVLTVPGVDLGLPDNVGLITDWGYRLTESAAFGEATLQLTDALDITAGVRAFRIEADSDASGDGAFNGGPTHVVTAIEEDGVNPKFGVSYRLNEDRLLFASAAKGFRPGAPATTTLPPNCAEEAAVYGFGSVPASYESDSVWSYELGSKNEFNGGRFLLNGALFYTDWSDIQQTVALPSCGYGFTTNAGQARVQGVELETRVNLTSNLQIGANATYTEANITEAGSISATRDGDRILDTPKWMASGYVTYSVPVSETWDLRLRGDYQYRSSAQRTVSSVVQTVTYSDNVRGTVPYAAAVQEGYEVVNASASLERGPTSVRFYLSNAFDARPWLGTFLNGGASGSSTIRPRTIGLEMRQRF